MQVIVHAPCMSESSFGCVVQPPHVAIPQLDPALYLEPQISKHYHELYMYVYYIYVCRYGSPENFRLEFCC